MSMFFRLQKLYVTLRKIQKTHERTKMEVTIIYHPVTQKLITDNIFIPWFYYKISTYTCVNIYCLSLSCPPLLPSCCHSLCLLLCLSLFLFLCLPVPFILSSECLSALPLVLLHPAYILMGFLPQSRRGSEYLFILPCFHFLLQLPWHPFLPGPLAPEEHRTPASLLTSSPNILYVSVTGSNGLSVPSSWSLEISAPVSSKMLWSSHWFRPPSKGLEKLHCWNSENCLIVFPCLH